MIIVRFVGGLGNQLFQYALGRHLALKNSAELLFDRTALVGHPFRQFRLNNFAVIGRDATPDEINSARVIKESSLIFNPNILNLTGDVYLDGYWQSEAYFKDIRDVLLKDFQLLSPTKTHNLRYLESIAGSLAVCIHIRRGDYASNPITNSYHGVLPMDYYFEAIEKLQLILTGNPHFFFFTDDPDWVASSRLFQSFSATLVRNNKDHEYDDLKLMAACKHFIIANSSFSWWAAWLGATQDKYIYAPKQWFLNTEAQDNNSIVPTNWNHI